MQLFARSNTVHVVCLHVGVRTLLALLRDAPHICEQLTGSLVSASHSKRAQLARLEAVANPLFRTLWRHLSSEILNSSHEGRSCSNSRDSLV